MLSPRNRKQRLSRRRVTVDEKIKKLDAELARFREQIKKTRPGPAQEAVKARAMRIFKQRRICNILIILFMFIIVDGSIPKTHSRDISAPKSANKELKGMMKIVNSSDVDSMQDKMMDLSTEILESSGRSYDVANDIDEEELVGGMLDALESDMGAEMESDAIPSYLQPDTETDLDAKLNLLQLQQAMLRQCPTERGSTPRMN
ncbi:Charged multivesicular body protein [Musa troglodytarum]|uniref:Charged multivesicular body protein n=1 Tax=Musa troglodytarum TaxID=320322 RepID=A0A9E7IEB7_9LILI|nr:Charged multivesicular body protein [Musa troglodytarum]